MSAAGGRRRAGTPGTRLNTASNRFCTVSKASSDSAFCESSRRAQPRPVSIMASSRAGLERRDRRDAEDQCERQVDQWAGCGNGELGHGAARHATEAGHPADGPKGDVVDPNAELLRHDAVAEFVQDDADEERQGKQDHERHTAERGIAAPVAQPDVRRPD